MSDMENIEDGFSQQAIVNEKEEEEEEKSTAPVNRPSDGETDSPAHHHHPSDVIHREEPGCQCGRNDSWSRGAGEADHCPVVGSRRTGETDHCPVVGSGCTAETDHCPVVGSGCTGETDHCPVVGSGCTAETDHCPVVVGRTGAFTPCARITASGGATMLDIVTGSGSGDSPTTRTTTVKNRVVSDGICGDCSSGKALGGTAPVETGGGVTEGPSVQSVPGSAGDGIDGGDAHNNQSFLSNADRTELPNTHSRTEDAVDAVRPIVGSETHPSNGQDPECSEGTDTLNVGCLAADLGTQACHCTGTCGMATKLVNGGLIPGENRSSSSSLGTRHTNPTSPLDPGGDTVGCLSHSRSEKPPSSSGAETGHGQGSPPRRTTGEEPQCRAQRSATEPRRDGMTRCGSELASRGVRSPNPEPGRVPVSPSIREEDAEEEEEEEEEEEALRLSNMGLSYTPTPGPRSLPCSVSYDSAPLSPVSRLEEAGSDEAFGDVQQQQQQQGDQRFMDVSLGSRNTYESSRRQSAPGHLPQGGPFGVGEASDAKRPGLTEYFGRGLFARKPRGASHSAPGWKLFGKVPLRESPTKDSKTIKQDTGPGGLTSLSTPDLLHSGEYETRQGRPADANSPTQHAMGRSRKNLEFEPLSTTALILENRPANLPAKSVEEAQRHQQLYDEMVAGAKKRELKEAQKKQKQMKDRFKQEEIISNAMVTWNHHILPHWDTMKSSRRARELWWQGLPPNVRGKVWSLAVGNELNITSELYGIFLSRAKEKWRSFSETGSESEADDGVSQADRESSLELIKLDISRTFPSLFIFQKGGPYHDLLHSVLGAYTCYRPDVGYVQGMSFIAAVLILNLEEADAFISFANLLNKPCQMAFFRVDHDLMLKYFAAFEVFFEENLPRLFKHFQSSNLSPDLYLIDWIFSLYTKSLPLDVACRVWDVFCRDGEEFLFRTGLGILRLYEDVLLQMDFIHIAQFLARLPDEELLSDRLFSCIAATAMVSGNRKWSQVFNSLIRDNREGDKMTSPSLKS